MFDYDWHGEDSQVVLHVEDTISSTAKQRRIHNNFARRRHYFVFYSTANAKSIISNVESQQGYKVPDAPMCKYDVCTCASHEHIQRMPDVLYVISCSTTPSNYANVRATTTVATVSSATLVVVYFVALWIGGHTLVKSCTI